MSVSVVVPFHASDEWRQRAWDHVTIWWTKHFPDWELIRCTSEGTWTKGASFHNGVKIAKGNTLILADADSFILDPDELAGLVARVDRPDGVPWIMPHRYVHRVSQKATEEIYATGIVDIYDINYPVYGGCVGGGMMIIDRKAWQAVRGVDPRFVGWGGEDRCFGWTLQTLVPGGQRGDARLIHLYHPIQGPRQQMSRATYTLIEEYRRAKTNPQRMAEYIAARAA